MATKSEIESEDGGNKSRSGHKTRNPFDFKKKRPKKKRGDEETDTKSGVTPKATRVDSMDSTVSSAQEAKSARQTALKKKNPFETKRRRGHTTERKDKASLIPTNDGSDEVTRYRSQAVPFLGQDAFARTTSDTLVGSSDSNSPEGKRNKAQRLEAIKEIAGQLTEYDIINHIQEGGMGIVFKAMQRRLKRLVAIKLLKTGKFTEESRKQRFLFEAEACAALKHPHIVQIIEVGEVSGNPYYVMDYVDGSPLDSYVAKQQLSPEQIAKVISQVAEAVHHFHSRGILHRDLKPDNILVDEHGEPKIIDFGVAKEMSNNKDSMTRDGAIIGTPHYMSPEQAFGKVLELDIRADVYALGAILYRLLSGRTPYSSGALSLILKIQTTDPTPIRSVAPDLPWELAAIVTKAMEREVDRRYPTALAFKEDLTRFLSFEPVLAKRASHLYRAKKFIRRNKATVLIGTLLFVIVASSLGFALDQRLTRIEKAAEASRKEAQLAEAARAQEKEANEALKRELIAKTESAAKDRKLRIESEKNAKLAQEKADQERAFAIEREKRAEEKRRMEAESARKIKEADEKAAQRQLESMRAEVKSLLAMPRNDLLKAANNLSKALNIVGYRLPELRLDVESAKMDVVLKLARRQVQEGETKLASFWIDQGRSLEQAVSQPQYRDAIQKLSANIEELKRGLTIVTEAKAAAQRKDWPTARVLLKQARAAGALESDVKDLQEQVDQGCRRRCDELFAEARRLYNDKKDSAAYDKCKLALTFAADPTMIQSFKIQIAQRLMLKAQREACQLAMIPESAPLAPKLIENCAKRVKGTPFEAQLFQEYRQRLGLLTNNRLRSFHFIPAIAELKTKAVYFQKVEVSQAAFQRFVDARGYDKDEFWEKSCPREQREVWKARREALVLAKDASSRPVRGLSWYEARAYARWFSKDQGVNARLPSAKEWLAANWDIENRRLRNYPWGSRFEDGRLVFEQSAPEASASNKADLSPFGIYDLAGNVAEWISDVVKGQTVAAIKGADFFGDEVHTKKFSKARSTAYPDAIPSKAVRDRVGFRLVIDPS